MSRKVSLGFLAGSFALVAFASACERKEEEPPPPPAATPTPTPPPGPPAPPVGPESYRVQFETTKGNFVVEVTRSLSPMGADRFKELVDSAYFTNIALFRVVPGFVVQFGMHGDTAVNARWSERRIMDDPVKTSNVRGTVVYAKPGMPNSRSTQLFINLADNAMLDPQGFSPFGKVVQGMDVIAKFYAGYEGAPSERQPEIAAGGNAFLKQNYPKLDYIKSAKILP